MHFTESLSSFLSCLRERWLYKQALVIPAFLIPAVVPVSFQPLLPFSCSFFVSVFSPIYNVTFSSLLISDTSSVGLSKTFSVSVCYWAMAFG